MFPGESIARLASLRIGIEIAAAPELKVPRYATAESSWAARLAFADSASGVQAPAWAVESSSGSKLMVTPPASLPACSSASSIPFWIAIPVGREDP